MEEKGPLAVMKRERLEGPPFDHVRGYISGVVVLSIILISVLSNWSPEDPSWTTAVFGLAMFIAIPLFMAWRLLVLRSAATFELFEDRAVFTPELGRPKEVPLVEGTRMEVLRADQDEPLSRENAAGYYFRSAPRNWILLSRETGWGEEDLRALWDPFMRVVGTTECKQDDGLSEYLKKMTDSEDGS